MDSLEGQTIVVTGASSGIGAACCALLKKRRAAVIGLDINEPTNNNVDEFIAYDQGDPNSIDRAAQKLPEKLAALMNIAGVAPSRRFGPADVLRINFFGVRYLTELVVPKLVSGSAVVNMSSGTGAGWPSNVSNIRTFLGTRDVNGIQQFVDDYGIVNEGLGNDAAYPFSKQLLCVWTMQASGQWKSQGIRVNAVSPAAVETPIIGDFLSAFGKEAAERISKFGTATPEHVALASVFLLTRDAAWINGAILPVDGGAIAAGTLAKLGIKDDETVEH